MRRSDRVKRLEVWTARTIAALSSIILSSLAPCSVIGAEQAFALRAFHLAKEKRRCDFNSWLPSYLRSSFCRALNPSLSLQSRAKPDRRYSATRNASASH